MCVCLRMCVCLYVYAFDVRIRTVRTSGLICMRVMTAIYMYAFSPCARPTRVLFHHVGHLEAYGLGGHTHTHESAKGLMQKVSCTLKDLRMSSSIMSALENISCPRACMT